MVIKRPALIAITLIISAGAAYTEVSATVELQVYNTLSMLDKEEAAFNAAGIGTLTLSAAAAENVRTELSLEGIISAVPTINIPKGYIKVRFPWFRTTLGKAPISWGSGFAFNAGDVIFRLFTPPVQLSNETLRDLAKMQTLFFVPLGPFSFAEIVILPPEIDLLSALSDPGYTPPSISETRIGSRAYLQAGPLTIEPGYLYDGKLDTHFPYLSLAGHLLADWQIAGSLGIETQKPDAERIYETFILSAGGTYSISFKNGGSITIRLESLIYPAGAWEEVENNAAAGSNTDSGLTGISAADSLAADYPQYGLLFYPELNISITDSAGVFLRSLFSPIDMSALTSIGGSWNILNGFDLLAFISIEGGDESDTYAYGNPEWFSCTLGGRYIF